MGVAVNADAMAGTHSDVTYGGSHRYRQNPKTAGVTPSPGPGCLPKRATKQHTVPLVTVTVPVEELPPNSSERELPLVIQDGLHSQSISGFRVARHRSVACNPDR